MNGEMSVGWVVVALVAGAVGVSGIARYRGEFDDAM